MNLRISTILCVLIGLTATKSLAADQGIKSAESARIGKLVGDYVRQLGAADPLDVQAAIVGLSRLSPTAYPMIVAAADNPALGRKAKDELKKFIDRERVWRPARERIAKIQADDVAADVRKSLQLYDAVGRKSKLWDAAAREGIRGFAAAKTAPSNTVRVDLERAIAAGCDDPYVLSLEARVLELAGADETSVATMYDRATDGLAASAYSAEIKIVCLLHNAGYIKAVEWARTPGHAFRREQWNKMCAIMMTATTAWPAFVEEKPRDTTLFEASKMAIESFDNAPSLREKAFDTIYPPMEKAFPDNSTVLTIKGKYFIKHAWDARSNGVASAVTDEGWKLMAERLTVAEAALTKAWEKDHTNSNSATHMLDVELGQGQGRERMELWFKRAMEADPDNHAACRFKLNYLQPKWHGSAKDLLAFGDECYETQNWYGNLPMIRVDVFDELATYVDNREAFYSAPEVWAGISSVYDPYLRYFPTSTNMRSQYCSYCCFSGHWDLAQKQFIILGRTAQPKPFGGFGQMEKMRKTAEQKGTPANVP